MFRVAKKMLGDGDNASDIVQEVFISLHDKLNEGTVILFPNSWLYKVTINKCFDHSKRQKRFQSIDSIKDCKIDEELHETQDSIRLINAALGRLKPQEKVLAVLYSEGLSYKEISVATGIRFSSIGKTLSRTLEKLEIELKNQGYELY